jgi:hypothetical protein
MDMPREEQQDFDPSILLETVEEKEVIIDSEEENILVSEMPLEPQYTMKLDREEIDDMYEIQSDETKESKSAFGHLSEDAMYQSIVELNRDIITCVSLKIWSVSQLFEGKIDEVRFNQLYEGYVTRFEQGIERRKKMIEQANNIENFEKLLNQAQVDLEELEIRKSLDDLVDGEYDARAPAHIWEIQHYTDMISAKKKEIAHLKDLTKVVSAEKISEIKDTTNKLLLDLDNVGITEKFSNKTGTTVRRSLEEIKEYLQEN